MQYVITEQVSIRPLDERFIRCSKDKAKYQYEQYRTNKSHKRNIVAISDYSGTFSYTIGDKVNVLDHLYINRGICFNNIIDQRICPER